MRFEYDDQGNQVKQSYYTPDDVLTRYEVLDYDPNGNCIGSSEYDADGLMTGSYTVYQYDHDNRIIRCDRYTDNELSTYTVYEYTDDTCQVSVYSSGGNLINTYTGN